jgi:hypothetical protein
LIRFPDCLIGIKGYLIEFFILFFPFSSSSLINRNALGRPSQSICFTLIKLIFLSCIHLFGFKLEFSCRLNFKSNYFIKIKSSHHIYNIDSKQNMCFIWYSLLISKKRITRSATVRALDPIRTLQLSVFESTQMCPVNIS